MKMMIISGNNMQFEDLCCRNSAYNISTVHLFKQLSDILSLLIDENNHLFSMGTDLSCIDVSFHDSVYILA